MKAPLFLGVELETPAGGIDIQVFCKTTVPDGFLGKNKHEMRKMTVSKMERTSGGGWGPSIVTICSAYAFASIVQSGVEFGSVEAHILGSIYFDACLYQF